MAVILIVDDRPMDRQYLRVLLEHAGHMVVEASNGSAALAMVQTERPALIITDVLMPTMDGFTLVRELRTIPGVASTPVIFYSAQYERREAYSLARAGGVVHYLTKPAEPAELMEAIEQSLYADFDQNLVPPSDEFDRLHLRLLTDKLASEVDRLEAAHRRQASLADLSRRALEGAEPSALMRETATLLSQVLQMEFILILELNPNGDGFLARALVGVDEGTLGQAPLPLDADSLLGCSLGQNEPLIISDFHVESRFGAPAFLLNEGVTSGMSVMIPGHDRPFGVLVSMTARPRMPTRGESDFLQSAANLLASAIERRRVGLALEEHAEQLRELTRTLLGVQEAERGRIARELHDEIGQSLTALKINFQKALHDPEALAEVFNECIGIVDHTLAQVRGMALDLRPPVLDDLGLVAALQWYVERHVERTTLAGHFITDLDEIRVDPEVATACFRVTQEALTNIARHARAEGFRVELRASPTELLLIVRDDGVGFDPIAALTGASQVRSLGLAGMRERVELVGGHIEFRSEPEAGTEIRAVFPSIMESARETDLPEVPVE